ncbi:MAG: phasin family protein [Gammaproteobacteria bacterium]|nr:MAG: phasin family protein [Gammaproteobacteria bacterium]
MDITGDLIMDFNSIFDKFNIDSFNLDAFKLENFDMNQITNATKDAIDSVLKINETVSARTEQIFRLSTDIANDTLESSLNQLKALTDVKKPEQFIESQMNFASDSSKKAVENSQKVYDLLVEAQTEIGTLVQDSISKK